MAGKKREQEDPHKRFHARAYCEGDEESCWHSSQTIFKHQISGSIPA